MLVYEQSCEDELLLTADVWEHKMNEFSHIDFHPKDAIIFSPSCRSKPCGTQNSYSVECPSSSFPYKAPKLTFQ